MNEASFQIELQGVFITEAEELLDQVETTTMALEQNPSDQSKIDHVFRLVHTVKGSAHVAGFSDIGLFAHHFETLLSALRGRRLTVTPAVIDIMLGANDILKDYVHRFKTNIEEAPDTGPLIRQIDEQLSGVSISPKPPSQTPIPAPSLPPINTPKDSDSKNAVTIPLGGTPNPTTTTVGMVPISQKAVAGPKAKAKAKTPPIFLIVDDDPEILKILEEYLVNFGYSTVCAKNGYEAMDIFENRAIDAIFTDLNMPHLSGIEFIRAVRAINELVPVVFISGHSERHHLKEYISLGVFNFIEKPFDKEEIQRTAARVSHECQLQSSLINLSKLSFKIYVSTQKFIDSIDLSPVLVKEKANLEILMADLRIETNRLLDAEKSLKSL